MYYKKISAPVILIFISAFFLQGCSNESTSPIGYISGMVLDASKVPITGLKVKIGNESTVTNEHGSFKLKNDSYPYDMLVIDETSKSQLLIKSISLQMVIVPDFLAPNVPGQYCNISVTLPSGFIHSGKKGKLILTNGFSINSYKDIVSENTSVEINIKSYSGYKGKMIILTYLTDASDNIISYENYYESSEIFFIPDQSIHFDIDSSQLAFNPGERTLSGNIYIPPGYTSSNQYFYLNFAANNSSFNFPDSKFSLISGNDFNIIVPEDLPSDFSIMINNYIGIPGGDKYSLEAFKLKKNSDNVTLTAKLPPGLISPAENAIDVGPQTEISHSAGDGSGVSIVRFFMDGKIFSIITSSETFLFSELSKFEIGEIKNSNFFWTVQKYGEIPDLETYLSWYPADSSEFVSKGEQRNFKTAP